MTAISNWLATLVVNSVWQIAAITAIAMLAARVLRRAPSRQVHMVWVIALAACLLVPPMTLQIHSPNPRLSLEPGSSADANAVKPSEFAKRGIPVSFRSLSRPVSFPPVFLRILFWTYGVLLFMRGARLAWAGYHTIRIRKRAFACAPPLSLSRAAERCRRTFSLAEVLLLCTKDAAGPSTIGIGQPVLILPERFFDDSLEEADIVCAVSHEFAHIRRHDFVLNLLYELAYVPLCFHPCAVLIMARIGQTRELACDEMAAQMSPSPRQYAQSLLQIARAILSEPRQKVNYGLGLFDTNILEERVMNILATTRTDWEWTGTRRWTAACLVAAVCLSLSAFSLRVTGGSSPAELERFVGTWQAKYNGKVFFTLRINSENGRLGGTCTHVDRLEYVDGELIPTSDTMSTEKIAEAQISGQRLLLKIANDPSDTIPLEFTLTSNGAADGKILVESSSGTPAPKKAWHFERVSASQ